MQLDGDSGGQVLKGRTTRALDRPRAEPALPLIKRRKRLFSSLDSWTADLRSYHTEKTLVDGLQTVFIDIDREDRVLSGCEWRDIRRCEPRLTYDSKSSLIDEMEVNVLGVLESKTGTPYKYLKLVCIVVSYFRKIVWDVAVQPRKREALGLESWMRRKLQLSGCSPQFQSAMAELLGYISEFMSKNSATKPTGALVRVLDRWLMEQFSAVYVSSEKHMLLALAGDGQGEFVGSVALRWRFFHTLWWCVHQAPEMLERHHFSGVTFRELIVRQAGCEFLDALLKSSEHATPGPPQSLWQSTDLPVSTIDARGREAGDWFIEFMHVSCRLSVPVLIKGGVLSVVPNLRRKVEEIISLCAGVRTEVAKIPYPGREKGMVRIRDEKRERARASANSLSIATMR
jgi:hypothetical protein